MTNQFRRHLGGAAIGVALVSAASPRPASAATMLTVGKANPTAEAIIPVDIGHKLGMFKKHGLDLKIINFAGGSKMAQAMAAGSIDIGDGAGTEMALVAKGVPMKAVCEDAGPLPFIGIGVPWDSPVKSLKGLKGKRIGVSAAGSLTDWLAHELERKEGWGPHGVKIIAIGGGPAPIAAAFGAHQVDAAIGSSSVFLEFAEHKKGRLLAPVSAFEGNVASGTIYASNKLIATDPAAVHAFLAGWIETVDYMRKHKTETVKILSSITHFSRRVMAKEYAISIGMFNNSCQFDSQSLATLKRSFVRLKLLPKAPDMSKLYTTAFMPK